MTVALIFRYFHVGTAVFWVAMITHPELNEKIEMMMALAPAASVANVKSFVRLSAVFVDPIEVDYFLCWSPSNSIECLTNPNRISFA